MIPIISFLNFSVESNKASSKQTTARASSFNDVLESTHYLLKLVLKNISCAWANGHLTNFSLFREAGPRDGVQEAGPGDGVQEEGLRDGVQEVGQKDGMQDAVLLSGYHHEESSTSSAQFTLWGVLG